MFPEESHVKIVKRIDELEADVYTVYCRLQRLRLDLQAQWRVLPSDDRWTPEKHEATKHQSR